MDKSKNLRRRFLFAVIGLIIAFCAVTVSTFAWYLYNTAAHTTNVHMAAGASVSLQISNEYDGTYGSSTVLDSFVGTLNPVSTNRISGGFQKVFGFTNGKENQSMLVANLFKSAEDSDFYKTSLFLKTSGRKLNIYVSDIAFDDADAENPISSAIRVGLVVHRQGKNMPEVGEYIFAISDAKNPKKEYNTANGYEGCVLDCTKDDGSVVEFTPLNSSNFCFYDKNTGAVSLKTNSLRLCELEANDEAVQVDIYIWLEGCDEDCFNNLCGTTLKNISVSFAGDYDN